MRKIIIRENQRGFLFKNGKYIKMLAAGKYYVHGGKEIEVANIDQPIVTYNCALDTVLGDCEVARAVSVVEVEDCRLALHFVNGKFNSVLGSGKHAFFTLTDKHEYRIVDVSTPFVADDIPEYVFTKMPSKYYCKVSVPEYHKAVVYFNQKAQKILDAGTYYFWENGTKIDVSYVDTRLTQMNITGQEMLTQDKVSLRINFVCNYRVTDCARILTEIDDFEEQIHVCAQLALREYVGKYKLDEILENKDQISEHVFGKLKEKEKSFFVEFTDAGVKDIILPGEVREIMNTVLIAEKRAQANVISRREEVASTRSLLNTAKLMDENSTLYKLKELEYIERICENVGNINLNAGGDILAQLTGVVRGKG